MDELKKKTSHIYTRDYYVAITKNEIMSFAGKWIELKVIMWSEISQTQKTSITCFFSLHNLDFFLKDIKSRRRTIWEEEGD
jgi:hypothetical protein